jgi:hypothetical protein
MPSDTTTPTDSGSPEPEPTYSVGPCFGPPLPPIDGMPDDDDELETPAPSDCPPVSPQPSASAPSGTESPTASSSPSSTELPTPSPTSIDACAQLAGVYLNLNRSGITGGICSASSIGSNLFSMFNEDGQTATYYCSDNLDGTAALWFYEDGPNGGWGGSSVAPTGTFNANIRTIGWSSSGLWQHL